MYLHYIHLEKIELTYFLIILFFKVSFGALFDFRYLKSYYLFLTSLDKCKAAKKTMMVLQKKKNIHISVRDVVDEIKRNIPATGVEIF